METTAFHCLICYEPVSHEDSGAGSSVTEQEDLIAFTLRCFLQLDKFWTENKLKLRCGEIRLCYKCRKGVEQAKSLYRELVEMAKKFREKQRKAVKSLRKRRDGLIKRQEPRDLGEQVRQLLSEHDYGNFHRPLLIQDWATCTDYVLVKQEMETLDLNEFDGDGEVNMAHSFNEVKSEPENISDEGRDVDLQGNDFNSQKEWSGAEETETIDSTPDPPPIKKSVRKRKIIVQCEEEMEHHPVKTKLKKPPQKKKRGCIVQTEYSKERPLKCDLCGLYYKNSAGLNRHRARIHNIRAPTQYACPDAHCEKTFAHLENMQSHHAKVHTKTPLFHCDLCGGGFYKKTRLITHQQMYHSNLTFVCELCGKSYTSASSLSGHLSVRHKDRDGRRKPITPAITPAAPAPPELCPQCGKSFANAGSLRTHLATVHSQDPKFLCELCQQGFVYKAALDIHLYSKHKMGERPPEMDKRWEQRNKRIQCQVPCCKRKFPNSSKLEQHVKEVHGESGTELPFKCRFCGKGFGEKNKFTEHEMIHTNKDTKPFKCEFCGKGFVNRSHMRTHQLLKHNVERKFARREERVSRKRR